MEIEYAVAARYRNNGYAMQAVKKMLDYGFKPKFPRPLYLGGRGKLYVHSLKNELLPRSNLSKQFFSILKYDHF